jgi:putative membrane protein
MRILTQVLVALVALEHAWFLVLEMFLWQKPIGLRTFRTTPEFAAAAAALAANQGLYNGFLAAGLVWGLLAQDPDRAFALQTFFLGCVVVAGAYGAYTVSRSILWGQALPALVALALLWTPRLAA